jgi:glyoxylase-like metal-dependent hydrolase (beta-lactamase superfamily II)
LGRGERVLPGVWRLRLPLPWPGVPHCNAWALAAGDGIVLVDTGMHEPGSMAQLERALAQCNLSIENVRTVVCTHAHSDHYGQAATLVERTGCDVWLHPNHEHLTSYMADPEAAFERRIEVALQSGVPEEPLRRFAERRRGEGSGVAGLVAPMRDLVPGVEIDTDLGKWSVHYTPGHAPSHVCLFEPGRRLLISGDHLLGRVSLFYDYGWTPDPVGEFLESLNVVEALDARLCLPGHGRTFADVQAHIDANRELVASRLARVQGALDGGEQLTAFEIVPQVYDDQLTPMTAGWWLQETLSYLQHLERVGRASRSAGRAKCAESSFRRHLTASVGRPRTSDSAH